MVSLVVQRLSLFCDTGTLVWPLHACGPQLLSPHAAATNTAHPRARSHCKLQAIAKSGHRNWIAAPARCNWRTPVLRDEYPVQAKLSKIVLKRSISIGEVLFFFYNWQKLKLTAETVLSLGHLKRLSWRSKFIYFTDFVKYIWNNFVNRNFIFFREFRLLTIATQCG